MALTYSSPESIKLAAHTEKVYVFNRPLSKSQVKLWHFDHPTLYKSTVTLQDQNGIVFQQTSRFGIRKIEIDGLRFLLNGESVRLAGYNWVADDRTTGNTLPEFRFKEDIDLMKTAGANMARISHRPLPDDVMDYLDEKGILVLAEFNNWPPYMNAESEEPKIFAKKLVEQNFNHPSIFGWSIGNENGSLKDFPKVNEYFSSIIDYIKKIDRNRFVTYVSHTADFQDNDAVKFCDLIMMNKYGNFEKAVDNLKIRYPNKIVFLSEYGAHADNLIYDTPNNSTFKSLMVDNLRRKENLIGYSIWTFNDYRSSYQTPVPSVSTPLHQHPCPVDVANPNLDRRQVCTTPRRGLRTRRSQACRQYVRGQVATPIQLVSPAPRHDRRHTKYSREFLHSPWAKVARVARAGSALVCGGCLTWIPWQTLIIAQAPILSPHASREFTHRKSSGTLWRKRVRAHESFGRGAQSSEFGAGVS